MDKVIFRDRQELQQAELSNIGDFVEAGIDAVVMDCVTDERRYTGLAVTQETSTSVRVALGRFYSGGKVYQLPAEVVINLSSHLPLANKKLVAVVAWGQEIDTDIQPRDFLIDLETGVTEPQPVPMLHSRQAVVGVSAGTESVDPQLPSISEPACLVAIVTMSTTGVSSIEAFSDNKLPSVEANASDIAALKTFQADTGPKVQALTSQMAALAKKTDGKADLSSLYDVMRDIARVKDKVGLPSSYAAYDADFFSDSSKIDTILSANTHKVKDGLLFPDAAAGTFPLALFNPYDANVTRSGTDLVLPKYTSESALATTGYAGEISVSQYQVQTHTLTAKTIPVYYWRYGWGWNWWGYYYYYRWYQPGYFYDLYSAGYWGGWYGYPVTVYSDSITTTSYNGALLGETFVAPRSGWLTSLDLYFTKIGASGEVTLAVCETSNGMPDMSKTLTRTTVAKADLKKYPEKTSFALPAAFLEAGKRYAFIAITQGDHYVARVDANNFTQGTLFYSTDGSFFQGDLTKDLMFSINMARFAAPRCEVMLETVSLAGGITDIEIAAQQVVPDGCELTYEIQVAGKWYPLTDLQRLSSQPNLVPLRAVFLGTNDLAPAIQLAAGVIKVSRPALGITAYSTLRTLPSAQSNIKVSLTLSNFDGSKNTIDVKLVDNAGANPVSASSVADAVVDSTGAAVDKVFTFNLGSPRSTYKMKIIGGRTSDGPPFVVAERSDIAY